MIESSLSPSEPVMLPGRPSGRVARSVLGYAIAIALMSVTIAVFVPAALFHCAIRNGRRAAWAAAGVALVLCAGYAAALAAKTPASQAVVWVSVVGAFLTIALPALAALPLVERGESFGRVLVFLLAGSIAGLALTEAGARTALAFSPYEAAIQQTKASNEQVIQLYRANKAPAEAIHVLQKASAYHLFVLPGSMLCILSLIFILSLMMLGRLPAWQNWVARRGDPALSGVYFFRNLALPEWLLFAFILGGLTPIATGLVQKLAANALVVVVMLYVLQGLAIFRFMLVAMNASVSGTLLAWMLLGFLTLAWFIGPLLLGVAGLFDPFFDFRHYKKRKDDSHESHSD